MAIDNSALNAVIGALKQDSPKNDNKTYQATVSRIDTDGTVWVNLAGSDIETPTAVSSAEVKQGDTVNVTWSNNQLYIGGNYTNPAAGVNRVVNVERQAKRAQVAADAAVADAGRASEAAASAEVAAETAQSMVAGIESTANQALQDAQTANDAATGAINGLSMVENVVGTLDWIASHGEYELTTDTTVISGRMYFSRTGTGTEEDPYIYTTVDNVPLVYYLSTDTVVDEDKTYYEKVGDDYIQIEDPDPTADPTTEGWYEYGSNPAANGLYQLSGVDESVQTYIRSHLALMDDGLYVFRDDESGYLVLSENKVQIKDKDNNVLAEYGAGTVIGDKGGMHIEIGTNSTWGFSEPIIAFYNGKSDENPPLSYIDSDGLSIPHAVIVNSLQIGDTASGAWRWIIGDEQDPTAPRHLKLIWIGAE